MSAEVLKIQTLQQLAKDLGSSWNFDDTRNWDYNDLQQYTATLLQQKFRHDSSGFMQWMYRIDMPEQDLRRLLKNSGNFDELAGWVIRREFLKVLLRNKYKIEELKNMPQLLS